MNFLTGMVISLAFVFGVAYIAAGLHAIASAIRYFAVVYTTERSIQRIHNREKE